MTRGTDRRTTAAAAALIALTATLSTTLVGGSATAASATSRGPSICYEVETAAGEWKDRDQGCDGDLVAPAGGVYGIAITVDGVKQVLYSASDGASFELGRDGEKVNSGAPTTALKVALSPRKKLHVSYTVTYDDPATGLEQEDTRRDNVAAGNDVDPLTSVRIRITK